MQVPLLLLAMETPTDGLPVLTDWMRTASDVWRAGYESWRAPIEVRPRFGDVFGKPMKASSLVPTKGIGRASVLLFAVCRTYAVNPNLEGEELADFQRTGFSNSGCHQKGRLKSTGKN